MKRCISALAQFKEGHSGEYTKTAEESCAAGVHRVVVPTLILQSENREPRQISTQSLINNLDAHFTASPDIRESLDEIDDVDPSQWPLSVESPWLDG